MPRSPGGGRAWPTAGYWSTGEFQTPVRCPIPEACIGVDPASPGDIAANFIDTQRCADGDTGQRCSQCADSYFTLNSRCYYCGSSTDQSRDIALTAVVALGAMSLLAVAAAFLSSLKLAFTVQAFVTLQSVAMIGVEGSKSLPFARRELSAAFTYISLISFDIEVLRPGRSQSIS